MSIWEHRSGLGELDTVKRFAYVSRCPHCSSPLSNLKESLRRDKPRDDGSLTGDRVRTSACSLCGWWKLVSITVSSTSWEFRSETYAAIASLKKLDLMDLSTPLSEIQSFLAARFESRFDLHPRLFEETAASVLVPEGFRARVTAYRKDGGIDAVFDGPGERIIGVQVKRYKANIGVELIREFTGALVVNGLTEGVFVTTSGFTADARRAAVIVGKRGYRVELVDPKRFLEALEIAQRPRYQDKEDLLSTIGDPPLHHIQETRVPRPAQP